MNNTMYNENLDLTFQQDKAEKSKRRWERIYENKQKQTIDSQMTLKQKLDKLAKIERQKKKKYEEHEEEVVRDFNVDSLFQKGLKEFKTQKFTTVHKRKELLEVEFQKRLTEKEQHLQQRMISTAEKRKRVDLESLNSKYYGGNSSNSKMQQSSAGDHVRAKSAYRTQHQTSEYFTLSQQQTQEEEEKMLMMISELEQRMQRAEYQKYNRLFETNIEKQHQHNEQIVQKKQFKDQKAEQVEYNRLKEMIDKSFSY